MESETPSSTVLSGYKWLLGGKSPFFSETEKRRWLRDRNLTYDQWLDSLQHIEYDDITLGFKDLLTNFYIRYPTSSDGLNLLDYHTENETFLVKEEHAEKFENVQTNQKIKQNSIDGLKQVKTYVSLREPSRKCLTIDTPVEKGVDLREIGMRFNTSSFPMNMIHPGKFQFYLTYPKQFLRAPTGSAIKFPFDTALRSYEFEIHVGYMRVFRRRDKTREPCNMEWNRHDEKQMDHVSKVVGCNPRHLKMSSHVPYCSDPNQYAEICQQIFNSCQRNEYIPPCRSIETILQTTKGKTNKYFWFGKSYFDLKIFLDEQTHYEEPFLFPSYSLQTLVGNAGMYKISRRILLKGRYNILRVITIANVEIFLFQNRWIYRAFRWIHRFTNPRVLSQVGETIKRSLGVVRLIHP